MARGRFVIVNRSIDNPGHPAVNVRFTDEIFVNRAARGFNDELSEY